MFILLGFELQPQNYEGAFYFWQPAPLSLITEFFASGSFQWFHILTHREANTRAFPNQKYCSSSLVGSEPECYNVEQGGLNAVSAPTITIASLSCKALISG